jgi:hypothetical protein
MMLSQLYTEKRPIRLYGCWLYCNGKKFGICPKTRMSPGPFPQLYLVLLKMIQNHDPLLTYDKMCGF